jgi:hypothetical protein
MTTPADIVAICDVLADVDESSDSLTIEDAAAMRDAVVALMAATRMTLALIDTQLVTTLESPRVLNGQLYEIKKSDGAWRPDHSKVDARVKDHSLGVNTATGEMRSAAEAVDEAMATMASLYRAASTMPKVGALADLGLKKWDVAEQEPGKRALKVTPVIEAPAGDRQGNEGR